MRPCNFGQRIIPNSDSLMRTPGFNSGPNIGLILPGPCLPKSVKAPQSNEFHHRQSAPLRPRYSHAPPFPATSNRRRHASAARASLKPARVGTGYLSPTFPKPSQMPCSHLELLVKLPAPMAASPSALRSAIPSQLAALDHQAVHSSAPPGRRRAKCRLTHATRDPVSLWRLYLLNRRV